MRASRTPLSYPEEANSCTDSEADGGLAGTVPASPRSFVLLGLRPRGVRASCALSSWPEGANSSTDSEAESDTLFVVGTGLGPYGISSHDNISQAAV